MEVYKLHCTFLLRLLVLYITIKVATAFSVTFVQDTDEETKLTFHEPGVQHGEKVQEYESSPRFSNLRKNIKRDRSHSEKRVRRAIIVRCCGMETCSPSEPRQRTSGSSKFLAYAKLTFNGVSISCPNCPKGWEDNLKWSWLSRGIPIVCKGCPNNWESLLNINEGTTSADTTDEEATGETDATDETEEPTTVKGKKTTAKVTTKATSIVTTPTTKMATNTTVTTTKPVTNATVVATTPAVVASTTGVEVTTTKAATTAAPSGGGGLGGLNLGGINLGSLFG